jgi:hypothetical protein
MPWTETSQSAWGELEIKIGVPGALNVMSTSLALIGNVKEDSFSIETEEGKKLQWFATGHNLVDELRLQGTLTLKLSVKNLNLAGLSKFWDVTEGVGGNIEVDNMSTSNKYSVKIASKVVGSETLLIPYCSVSMKPTYSEDSGFGQDIEFTILRPSVGAPLFEIGQVV